MKTNIPFVITYSHIGWWVDCSYPEYDYNYDFLKSDLPEWLKK